MLESGLDFVMLGAGCVVAFFLTIFFYASRFKRCPSDRILVVYGKVGGRGLSALCSHGGGTFVWPVFQDYQYLDLTPIPIDIKLEGALSQQNIRVNTPSTFMVGISTEPGVMENAAERLLGLSLEQIRELARDIIFGQMRVVIATMPIEEINADRDKLIANISMGVEVELKKVGLRLINVNIQDITDESGYIDALGKEAAARAINEAKVKVAQQERDGEIGRAEAQRDQRIRVADAGATAVEGENLAKVRVAQSDAARRQQEAEAERAASASEKVKAAQALQEAYAAEELSERQRAKREEATQHANIVVPAEIEKKRIETLAEAQAEQTRRTKKGEADGVRSMMEAEAAGLLAILMRKAEGFSELVQACGTSPEGAALMLLSEQMPKLVEEQVKAISNLKIDKVTVWDTGRDASGKNSTANFVSGLMGALPPIHDIARNAGVQLPEFLGKLSQDPEKLLSLSHELTRKAEEVKGRRATAREWLKQHRAHLVSFDLNADSNIDDVEMETAVKTAMDWATLIGRGAGGWFYAVGEKSVGPHTWEEILAVAKKRPGVFIGREDAPFWLPLPVLRLALGEAA